MMEGVRDFSLELRMVKVDSKLRKGNPTELREIQEVTPNLVPNNEALVRTQESRYVRPGSAKLCLEKTQTLPQGKPSGVGILDRLGLW